MDQLKLNDNSKLLEIGCGWGGFSTFVAKNYGSKVKAITISKKQYEFTANKIFNETQFRKITTIFINYYKVQI